MTVHVNDFVQAVVEIKKLKKDIFKPASRKEAAKRRKKYGQKFDIEEVEIGLDSAGKYEYYDTGRVLEDGDYAFRVTVETAIDEEYIYFEDRIEAEKFIEEELGA